MRLLATAVGSRGDVQPMLALAAEMRRRGHDVLVHAPADFEAWAGELGLAFASSGMNVQEIMSRHAEEMGANPVRMLRALRDVVGREIPRAFAQMMAIGRGRDAILTAGQFAAHSCAQALAIPSITVMYSPTMLRSWHHPPFVARLQRLPRWMNALTWAASDATLHAMLGAPINAERARLGLPAARNISRHLCEEQPVLMACDPAIAPPPPDWGRYDVEVTGPWFYDDAAPLDAGVERFLAAGTPPVYVGFGSMTSPDAVRLTRAILDAGCGRRLLLSKGWAGIGGVDLPPTAMVASAPLPHARLFPRVACVVHHGGSGTTASALRAGAPQVIVPHLMDQYYYAHRLERLGIAPAGIPIRKLTGPRLAHAIEAAMQLPQAPRDAAAARLREGDGVRIAAAAIEKRIR